MNVESSARSVSRLRVPSSFASSLIWFRNDFCSERTSINAADTVSDMRRRRSISVERRSTSLAPAIPPPNPTDMRAREPPTIAPPASVMSPLIVTSRTPPMFCLAISILSTMSVFRRANLIAASILGSYSRSSYANPITPGLRATIIAFPPARFAVNLLSGRKVALPAFR